MLKLAKSTNSVKEADTELAAGQYSRAFLCQSDYFSIRLSGDMSSRTVTLQNSIDNSTYFTYYADGADGTPTAQTFTSTHVPNTSSAYSRLVFGPGQYFRFYIDSGTGSGTADVDIQIAGDVYIQ